MIDIGSFIENTESFTFEYKGSTAEIVFSPYKFEKATQKYQAELGAPNISDDRAKEIIIEMITGSVASWDFVKDGSVLPVSAETIEILPVVMFKKLLEDLGGQLNESPKGKRKPSTKR